MPEPIIDDIGGLPQIECAPLYLTHEGLLNADGVVDAAGNIFAGERFQSGNDTRIFVRKYAPDGVTLLGQWAVRGPRGYKIDGFGFAPAGNDLDLIIVAHDTPQDPANRLSASGRARIADVFVPFGNQLPKAGAANAAPQVPQEPDVTPEEIRAIVRYEVERGVGRMVAEFGDDGVAGALRSRPAEGMAWIMDPQNHGDETAGQWQDALFQFVKNANAGVQANILGGLDAWGRARREELKDAIREVLREIDEPTEGETTK